MTYSGIIKKKDLEAADLADKLLNSSAITKKLSLIYIWLKYGNKYKKQIKSLIKKKTTPNFEIFVKREDAFLLTQEHVQHAPSLFLINDALNAIKIDKSWTFLDAGSGTGYAMKEACLKFKKVYGIEFDKKWVDCCIENLNKLKLDNYKVFHQDIEEVTVDFLKNINVFYLYNPFNGKLFENYFNKIVDSIQEQDRDVFLIYANSVCIEHILKQNVLKHYKTINYDSFNTDIFYYKKG